MYIQSCEPFSRVIIGCFYFQVEKEIRWHKWCKWEIRLIALALNLHDAGITIQDGEWESNLQNYSFPKTWKQHVEEFNIT